MKWMKEENLRRTYTSLITAALLLGALPAPAQAAVPHHLHAYFDDGEVVSEDPCHDGDRFRFVSVEEVISVTVCSMDVSEQPATTQDDGFLFWRIDTPSVATFETEPPSVTNDDGRATAAVRATDTGSTGIIVTWCPTAEDCSDEEGAISASVTLWAESVPHGGDPPCAFNGTGCDGIVLSFHQDREGLVGAVGDRQECMEFRSILLKKRRSGPDPIVSHVQTTRTGSFEKQVPRRWRGRYYAVAPNWKTSDAETGEEVLCSKRVSKAVWIP